MTLRTAGQIVLVEFPFSDLSRSKYRPVLLLRPASRRYADWVVCMISSRLHQLDPGIDQVLGPDDPDFAASGLKVTSLIRLSRLAVIAETQMVGLLGTISGQRLRQLRLQLGRWLADD